MYKILLVDDEPLIRRSMMKTINDADGEYFVCDQAGDGLDGIAKITEHKPDIIITDICMNRMTGLEMIEKIKNVVPNAKIIILTGYRDFEYAQKAIQLGAFGFILKPIKNAEIVELLSKAAESIDKERWQMQKNRTIEELSSNNISYIQEKILGDMLCETLTDDINSRYKIFIEDYGIEINCFNLVLIEILEHYKNNVEEKEVNEFLGNILNKDDYYYIFLDENIRAIILKNDENKYSKKDLSDLFNHLLSKINEKYNVNANIAISMIGNTKNDFFMLYQSSKKALSYIKTLGENIVIAFSDILGYDENRNICDELLKAKEELCDGIENNSENEIKNSLEKLEDISKSTDVNNINLLKSFYIQILLYMQELRKDIYSADKIDISNSSGFEDMIKSLDNVDELNGVLRIAIKNLTDKSNYIDENLIGIRAKKIIAYINENYMKQITLNDISEHIYISSFHTSRIFKKETGKNLFDYINEVRIEKAKELLLECKYKINEVSELVGIDNTNYFSRLFKKITGETPTAFMKRQ